jgi:hypothetical protein
MSFRFPAQTNSVVQSRALWLSHITLAQKNHGLSLLIVLFAKINQFLQGDIYLVTDNKELYGTTVKIIEYPKLIFPDLEPTEKCVGFEALKPEKFINDFKTKPMN